MKTYYILSLKHSPAQGQALWWGPNDAGYTAQLERAGVYTEEAVAGNQSYYNNGESTRAIECSVVKPLARHIVDWNEVRTVGVGKTLVEVFAVGEKL